MQRNITNINGCWLAAANPGRSGKPPSAHYYIQSGGTWLCQCGHGPRYIHGEMRYGDGMPKCANCTRSLESLEEAKRRDAKRISPRRPGWYKGEAYE